LEVLSRHGRTDVALGLNLQTTYPSFGFMIQGAGNPEPATTVWELWDSHTEGPGMNSRNHIMFGTNGAWMYRSLGGINPAGVSGVLRIAPSGINDHGLVAVSASTVVVTGPMQISWAVLSHSACETVAEDAVLTLSCPAGQLITSIPFASYGTPSNCHAGACSSANSVDIVSRACIGKNSCSVPATNANFGDPCFGTVKYLAASALCGGQVPKPGYTLNVRIPFGQNAELDLPIVASLEMSAGTATVAESSKSVWARGAYVPGVEGITRATMSNEFGVPAVRVVLGSGNYAFVVTSV